MATSSFTSSITINKKTAPSLVRVLNKDIKLNMNNIREIERVEKKDIKSLKFK